MVCKHTLRHKYILGKISEWLSGLQCVNASGDTVAWYAVPSGDSGDSAAASGHMFGVEEPYPHLAVGKTLLCYKTKDSVN